jgi:hypothetical protein
LFKKQLGINKADMFCDIETDYPVRDMCLCGDNKFLFLSGNSVGEITSKKEINYPWVSGLIKPSSLCCVGNNFCFIAEDNGSEIKKLDLLTKETQSVLSSLAHKEKIKLYYSKADKNEDKETAIVYTDKKSLFWLSAQLNRCFKWQGTSLESVVGNGREGYSLSNSLPNCMLNKPSGIVAKDQDIYICDDNHCIRLANKSGIKLVAGHPNKVGHQDGKISLLTNPTKIKASKRLAYFIDEGRIKSLSYSDYFVTTLAKIESVVAIDVNDQSLYFLRQK